MDMQPDCLGANPGSLTVATDSPPPYSSLPKMGALFIAVSGGLLEDQERYCNEPCLCGKASSLLLFKKCLFVYLYFFRERERGRGRGRE